MNKSEIPPSGGALNPDLVFDIGFRVVSREFVQKARRNHGIYSVLSDHSRDVRFLARKGIPYLPPELRIIRDGVGFK